MQTGNCYQFEFQPNKTIVIPRRLVYSGGLRMDVRGCNELAIFVESVRCPFGGPHLPCKHPCDSLFFYVSKSVSFIAKNCKGAELISILKKIENKEEGDDFFVCSTTEIPTEIRRIVYSTIFLILSWVHDL